MMTFEDWFNSRFGYAPYEEGEKHGLDPYVVVAMEEAFLAGSGDINAKRVWSGD